MSGFHRTAGTVRVVPYDERWPEAFEREEGRLAREHGGDADAYQAGKSGFISRIESMAAGRVME